MVLRNYLLFIFSMIFFLSSAKEIDTLAMEKFKDAQSKGNVDSLVMVKVHDYIRTLRYTDSEKCIQLMDEIIPFLNKNKELEVFKAFFLEEKGDVYFHFGDYIKTIEYYQKAYDLYRELNQDYFACYVYGGIGYTYMEIDENEKALPYILDALKEAKEKNYKDLIVILYSYLGRVNMLMQ